MTSFILIVPCPRPYFSGIGSVVTSRTSSCSSGIVLRRLTSKCLSFAARSAAFARLAPLQLGVSVKGGCEAVIYSVSHLMSSGQPDQRWVLLLDFTNAFNTINRNSMFEEFRAHIPGLSAWIESCYSGQPFLHLGSDTILNSCRVQQGDPLGPLGFALTLHPIVEHIRAVVPNLTLNVWYLDDGILVGSPRDIAAALNIIESDGPSLGLTLNRTKSLLFIPEDADASCSPLPPEIPITQRGFTLLGCPIGPPSFCEEVFLSRVSKVKTTLALGFCRTWTTPKWRLLSSGLVLHFLKWFSPSEPALPITSTMLWSNLTKPFESHWKPSWLERF